MCKMYLFHVPQCGRDESELESLVLLMKYNIIALLPRKIKQCNFNTEKHFNAVLQETLEQT